MVIYVSAYCSQSSLKQESVGAGEILMFHVVNKEEKQKVTLTLLCSEQNQI